MSPTNKISPRPQLPQGMLKELFTSKIRIRIIRLFLDNLTTPFHIREITRQARTEINAVRRELDKLEKIGFLEKSLERNRVNYSVRQDFPLFPELMAMFAKEFGLPARLRKELPNFGFVKFVACHHSLLRGKAEKGKPALMIVGNISLARLAKLIKEEEEKRGAEINYTVVSEDEFDFFKKRNDKFFTDFVSRPFFMVIGREEEFSS